MSDSERWITTKIHEMLNRISHLEQAFVELYRKTGMDKKMRKEVGVPLKKAEKLVKKAEKSNARLADYDERVRDPLIAKCKKKMK